MSKMALVLQGGGALGAYEFGVVAKLVEMGWEPVAVTGVSIGAINAAAVAGARAGDIVPSLQAVWADITLGTVPFWPASMQGNLSLLGNPNFWRSRTDYMQMPSWTSLCDVTPMAATLEKHIDFAQLNNSDHMRFAVTATSLQTGGPTTFSNYLAPAAHRRYDDLQAVQQRITTQHILASGALPPGFPPVVIDDCAYWDGGLFSNTPLDALLNLLEPNEIDSLPIFTIDLFATRNLPLPTNLLDVQTRALALQYENRFWAEYGGEGGRAGFTAMLKMLEAALPADSPLRQGPDGQADSAAAQAWRWMQRLRALDNVQVIEGAPAAAGGDHDFSQYAVSAAYEAGRAAARNHPPSAVKAARLHAVA